MKLLSILVTGTILFASCKDSTRVASSSADTTNKMATGTENKKEAKEQRNIQAAKELVENVSSHNTDAALKNADPGIADYGDGSMGVVKGVDSVKKYINLFLQAMPDFKGDNFMYFADGDRVAVVGEWSGTFKNDMMGMKATGKSFKIKDVDIFKFNDEGKIVEHRSIYPMAYMITGAGENKMK